MNPIAKASTVLVKLDEEGQQEKERSAFNFIVSQMKGNPRLACTLENIVRRGINSTYEDVFPRCNRRMKHLSMREMFRALSHCEPAIFTTHVFRESADLRDDIQYLFYFGIGTRAEVLIPCREKLTFRLWYQDSWPFVYPSTICNNMLANAYHKTG